MQTELAKVVPCGIVEGGGMCTDINQEQWTVIAEFGAEHELLYMVRKSWIYCRN